MLRERRSTDSEIKNSWRIAGSAGAVGIEIVVAIAIGYFGGNFLDHKLGTRPWLTIFGLVVGVGAAIKALVRVVRESKRAFGDDPDDPHPPQH
jgi:F0F1-type ATP synthase assembly protein I